MDATTLVMTMDLADSVDVNGFIGARCCCEEKKWMQDSTRSLW
jgi:hypothetical protein